MHPRYSRVIAFNNPVDQNDLTIFNYLSSFVQLNLKKKKDCTLFTPMERTRVKLHDSSRHFFCPSLRLCRLILSIWVDGYCSGGRSHTSGSKTSCGCTIRLVICLLFLRMRSPLPVKKGLLPLFLSLSLP